MSHVCCNPEPLVFVIGWACRRPEHVHDAVHDRYVTAVCQPLLLCFAFHTLSRAPLRCAAHVSEQSQPVCSSSNSIADAVADETASANDRNPHILYDAADGSWHLRGTQQHTGLGCFARVNIIVPQAHRCKQNLVCRREEYVRWTMLQTPIW